MADPIEDFFRDRLQQHEEMPPANGWHRISQSLENERKPFAFWRWLSLGLLPIATAVLVVKNLPESEQALTSVPPSETQAAATAKNAATTANIPKQQLSATGKAAPVLEGQRLATSQPVAATPALDNTSALNTENTASSTQPKTPKTYSTDTLPNTASKKATSASANQAENSLALAGSATIKATAVKPAAGKASTTGATEKRMQQHTIAVAAAPVGTNSKDKKKANQEESEEQPVAQPAGNAAKGSTANTAGSGIPAAGSAQTSVQGAGGTGGAATGAPATAGSLTPGPKPVTGPDSLTAKDPVAAASKTAAAADSAQQATAAAADTALAKTPEPASPDEERKANNRFRIAFYVGADYGLRRFSPNKTDEVHIQQLTDKNKAYPARLDYEAGMLLRRPLTEKFAVEAGAGALYFKEQVEFKAATGAPASYSISQAGSQLQLQPTYQYSNVQTTTEAIYGTMRAGGAYSVLELGQTRVEIAGGGLLKVLAKHKTTTSETDLNLRAPEPAKAQAGAYAGLRLLHTLPSGAAVAFEPGFQYFVTPWQRQSETYKLRSHAATLNLIFFLK